MTEPGRFVMVDIPGPTLKRDTIAFLRAHRPRGVCLFKKNVETAPQTRALVEQLLKILGPDALIAIDQEGGSVVRSSDLPYPPPAMSLGAANDPTLAREMGRLTGRGLRALGVNWNFAPVLDVNNNPLNPVISERSFGANPNRVAALGAAFARGLQEEGVAACGKHFPGHGDTGLDSHLDLPRVERDRAGLEALELAPFKACLKGLAGIMTAHIVYPALDDTLTPATLSGPILTGLLRREWGYGGVIITDSMRMKAIDDRHPRGEAAVQAMLAGADMVMALGPRKSQLETLNALKDAFRAGLLDAGRLEASERRLAALAARYPARPRALDDDTLRFDLHAARLAWRRGVTLVPFQGRAPSVPARGARVRLLMARAARGENVAEAGLSAVELAQTLQSIYDLEVLPFDPSDPLAVLPSLMELPRDVALILASTGRRRPSAAWREMAQAARPDLHLALWNPFTVEDVPAPAIVTYGYRPPGLAALLDVLLDPTTAGGDAPAPLRAGLSSTLEAHA